MSTHTTITSASMAVPTFKKKNRNSADRHPSVPADPFDHHATSTFTIVFGTAILEAFDNLPCFSLLHLSTIIFVSFGSQVGPNDQPPDCAPRSGVSRSHQFSR